MKNEQQNGHLGRDAAEHVGSPALIAGSNESQRSSSKSSGHPGTKPTQSWVKYVDSRMKQFGTR